MSPSGRWGQVAENDGQVVDRLDGRVRIVDRGRQSFAGDIDELPDAEADVLLHRPLETDPDPTLDRVTRVIRIRYGMRRRRSPHPAEHGASHDMFARVRKEADGDPSARGVREQERRMHCLDVSRMQARDRHGPCRRLWTVSLDSVSFGKHAQCPAPRVG